MKKTAKFIKKLSGFTGDARLYKLSPSLKWGGEYDGDASGTTDFVVVSATCAMFSGPETFIFPADEKGKVIDWGELKGSFAGELDHVAALVGAGYTIEK